MHRTRARSNRVVAWFLTQVTFIKEHSSYTHRVAAAAYPRAASWNEKYRSRCKTAIGHILYIYLCIVWSLSLPKPRVSWCRSGLRMRRKKVFYAFLLESIYTYIYTAKNGVHCWNYEWARARAGFFTDLHTKAIDAIYRCSSVFLFFLFSKLFFFSRSRGITKRFSCKKGWKKKTCVS